MKTETLAARMSILFLAALLSSCGSSPAQETTAVAVPEPPDRTSLIPVDAVKMNPETDPTPPQLYADDFEAPVPVPGLVNTAGAEDGVFILPDGRTMYFFFTPDVDVPIEEQILDGVTGLYVSHLQDGSWDEPERIMLQEPGKLAMDGCEFVQDNRIWFCTAREGYTGLHWFTAGYADGNWQNWLEADFNPSYQVGELHFSRDWSTLYFGSEMPGGLGGLDIWQAAYVDGTLQQPVNLSAVNTPDSEGGPALNPAEDELWITRNWGVWRSRLVDGAWQEAELVVSPLAGEASVDEQGNLYFVHHYYVDGQMIEADIYVAARKR